MNTYVIYLNDKYLGMIHAENYRITITDEGIREYKINFLDGCKSVARINSKSEIVIKEDKYVYIEQ